MNARKTVYGMLMESQGKLEKSQGKVREFQCNQEISILFKNFDFESINTRKKVCKMLMESQGKLEKVRELRVKNLADTLS